MASFIIHTIAGEKFLSNLSSKYGISLNENDKNLFLLGNLIPDSLNVDKSIPINLSDEEMIDYQVMLNNKIHIEKLKTHFRDESKENLCIKSPELNLFTTKYSNLLSETSVLGYLFHLYTDKIFFNFLFPLTFESLDKNGQIVIYDNESETIRIKKNNKLISAKEFWTGTSKYGIYNDYTIINKLLLESYGTTFDSDKLKKFASENFHNPGLEEVNYNNIYKIITDTEIFIRESYETDEIELNVFDYSQVKKFIENISENFMIEYKELLDSYISSKKNQKVLKRMINYDICK